MFSEVEGERIGKIMTYEELKEEIISTFYNDKYFGLVLKGNEEEEPYILQLFDPSGRKKCSKGFDKEYQDISISGDMIIMCDSEKVMMYNLKGILNLMEPWKRERSQIFSR